MSTPTNTSFTVVRNAFTFCMVFFCIVPGLQAQIAPKFKVIAFYNGTYDAAHISFVTEAHQWFPNLAAQYNFSYESTTN